MSKIQIPNTIGLPHLESDLKKLYQDIAIVRVCDLNSQDVITQLYFDGLGSSKVNYGIEYLSSQYLQMIEVNRTLKGNLQDHFEFTFRLHKSKIIAHHTESIFIDGGEYEAILQYRKIAGFFSKQNKLQQLRLHNIQFETSNAFNNILQDLIKSVPDCILTLRNVSIFSGKRVRDWQSLNLIISDKTSALIRITKFRIILGGWDDFLLNVQDTICYYS